MTKFCGRRFLSGMLSFVLILTYISIILPIASLTSEAAFTESKGGAVPSKYFDGGTAVFDAESWTPATGSTSALQSHGNSKSMRILSRNLSTGGEVLFPEVLSCDGYSEIGVYLRPIKAGGCTVTLTAVHDSGSSAVTVDVPSTEESYIFIDLPEKAASISKVSFTAQFTEDPESTSTASVVVHKVVLSEKSHTDTADKYSAFNISGTDGEGYVSDDTPVTGNPVLTEDVGTELAVRVSLEGKTGAFNFHFAPDGENFSVCGSSVITDGRESYLFTLSDVVITKESAYKIEFTGTQQSSVKLTGVNFIPTRSFVTYDELGSITKCAASESGDTVNINGTITRDAAVDHIKGEICLFEAMMWQDPEDALKEEPIDVIDMSTSFSFSVPAAGDGAVFTSYVVAIREEDTLLPLSDPIFPSMNAPTKTKASAVSVSGISCGDAFVSGYDRYVIDIDSDSFFLEKSGQDSTVFTHDGISFYPDREKVASLDNSIQFLNTAGIGVIFRISKGNTSGFDPENEQDCRTAGAVIAYLTQKYSPYGFIIHGTRISVDGVSENAYATAGILRLAFAASKGSAVIYAEADINADTEASAWFLAKYMADFPKVNWELIISGTDGSDGSVLLADAVETAAADGGYSSQLTVSAKVSGHDAADVTAAFSEDAKRSYLIEITDGIAEDSPSINLEAKSVMMSLPENYENRISLWDFTNSYDSGGFTVPAGPTGISTGYSDALSEYTGISTSRTLMTELDDSSRIILASPEAPMNLTEFPMVEFILTGDASTPYSMDIVFISGRNRAVFTAEFDGAGVYSPVCDLTGTAVADKVECIAFILREGGPVELGIASVSAVGTDDSAKAVGVYVTEESTEISEQTVNDTTENDTPAAVYALAVVVVVVTIAVFATLSIKKT